ncbi:hypothetical protein ACFQVC_26850 [Streptomyces monticola]|uniref:Uncharacterized protein n=1 Tax=Streptomyces monticola TaxID=2666263 RepID=A0ABW2JQS5_9ACTN
MTKIVKRAAITSAAVLLGSLAAVGVAQASSGSTPKTDSPHSRTVERPAGTDSIPARQQADTVQPSDPSNKYSQTVERPAGTDSVPGRPAK